MSADDVAQLYASLDSSGITIWIDGGWAIDALVGRQTRPHSDLDIAIRSSDLDKLRSFLRSRGYREFVSDESNSWNFVLGDDDGHRVDVHAFVLDEWGHVVEGIEYPDGSLTGIGTINGVSVRCIAAEHLLAFHTRYEPREKDRQDVAALCEKFGFVNPFD